MASMATHPTHNLTFTNPKLPAKRPFYTSSCSPFPTNPHSFSRVPDSTICRCQSSGSNSPSDNSSSSQWRWDAALQDVFRTAIRRLDSFMNSSIRDSGGSDSVAQRQRGEEDEGEEEWNWDRWKRHFDEIVEQERLVSVLKSQLSQAIHKEDYEDAGRLKVAIAAAATNDTVGRAISCLNRAVAEERYGDAAFLRDYAGAGLVGWWTGISEDLDDPHGLIIRITAEHGRYVARSYSPRQLATTAVGAPLFEIFLTTNNKGEYKQQAVYLKRSAAVQNYSPVSSKAPGSSSRLDSSSLTEDKSDLLVVSTEDEDDPDSDGDSDAAEGLPGFQNILRDMIPGVKVKVLNVTAPGKVDRDFISKVIEQIVEDEDEDKDMEIESADEEEEEEEENFHDGKLDKNKDEMDVSRGILNNEGQNELAVKVVVSDIAQKLSGVVPAKSLRVPAELKKKGHSSFCFSIEKDVIQQDSETKRSTSFRRRAGLHGQRSIDNVMFDLAKFAGREKIPLKVLKDVGQLLNLTLSQAQNRQPLSGSTTFHRIETPASQDPLNGLYIGAHGLYTTEVIHVQRKFGQWQENSYTEKPSNIEFYEYVEAIKLTGDPYVPAGQVAFRAKVGKSYQLPHKGIIPEEFGVIARYKGQGRLAEPGFHNPRWVDGELVILDGKYIKGGPVIGFVYWAPEYHFLVFFNRLRLQQ
ncbi:protein EXECUTER 1, chloroplastic [Tripterygium wilfordii]|uniref:protein EXECUTER 1, chloroplastic n=1 Tax=Tripterygium wilfordii TaxID=458696 RepID=UPI0018F834EB|nr:protein EXECUTER 1, chloroplastic [Tripterygium wilfordii]XP_038683738.1 protein EXECUTER 1, chloroplastic [Tripterygium wilfordii]